MFTRHRECNPCIYTQCQHKQSLYGMHDKYKVKGVRLGYAVENKHGFYSEMPWPCAVRSGHNHRNAAHYKGN